MSDYTFNPTLAPSGCFCATTHEQILPLKVSTMSTDISPAVTFNPSLIERHRGTDRKLPAVTVPQELIQRLQIAKYVITESGVEDYARAARELTAAFQAAPSHCHLAPLRGARFPALFVHIMSEWKIAFDHFDYQQGCARVRGDEQKLRDEVTAILLRRNPHEKLFRIGVVDVVKGGYGIPALMDLLETIKLSVRAFNNQHWQIDLRLLHATDLTDRLRDLMHRSRERFEISVKFYRVLDVVVEDFDEAIGFELVSDDGISYLKPCVTGGRFLYKGREGVAVVESNDLNVTLQDYIAQKITYDLLTDPNVRQIADRWNDYANKG